MSNALNRIILSAFIIQLALSPTEMRQGRFMAPINVNSSFRSKSLVPPQERTAAPLVIICTKLCQSELIGGNFEYKEFEINLFKMVANTIIDDSSCWLKSHSISRWSAGSGQLVLSLPCSWARLSARTRFCFWHWPARICLGGLGRKAVGKTCWHGIH